MKDLETQLKVAIEKSGLSQYQLAKRSGVSQAQLSYFLSGQRDLTLSSASKIAKVLGLELKPGKKKGKLIGFEFGRITTKVVIGKKKR